MVFNLEKIILINEILSFIGLLVVLSRLKSGRSWDKASFFVLLLFIYCLAYSALSYFFLRDGSAYQFIRTLPLFYSIPCFFLGGIFYDKYSNLFFSKERGLRNLGLASFSIAIGGRLSNQALLPFLISVKSYRRRLYFLLVLMLIFCIIKGGATSYAFLIFTIYLLFDPSAKIIRFVFKPLVFPLLFGLFVFCLYLIYVIFESFYRIGFSFFGENSDVNSLWRVMYWAYVIHNEFLPSPVFGIGFGTRLFDPSDPSAQFIVNSTPNDPDLPYVHGPHNSLIYILVRTGVIGFLLFSMVLTTVLKRSFKVWQYADSLVVKMIAISFLLIFISAFFNVVIETPIYSGIFWALLGTANAASLNFRKKMATHEK